LAIIDPLLALAAPIAYATAMNDRLRLIRTISNRLLIALGVLMALIVPGAMIASSHSDSIVGATPLMTLMIGAIGGFVGLQRRLKQLPDDDLILLGDSWVYVALSPVVGGILAALMYILFISGLLAGDLFPKFVPDAAASSVEGLGALFCIHGAASDYAKLIFWCFLAGFSERFAVDIISQFESRGTNAAGSLESGANTSPAPRDAKGP
jgi:hypothetical protein